jgi:hypothetical protein
MLTCCRSSKVSKQHQLNRCRYDSAGGTVMFFSLSPFTKLHVVISLIGIVSGLVVMFGLLAGQKLNRWTALFLISTVATSVTGFFFPFHGVTPAIVVGIISVVLLAVAIFARYARHLAGSWRWIYVVMAMISLYLNVFVLVVQLFQKVPALKALAPTQSEPPFAVTQLVVLALFVLLTIIAAIRFRGEQLRMA